MKNLKPKWKFYARIFSRANYVPKFFIKSKGCLVVLCLLYATVGICQVKTRVSGTASWNTASTWIQLRTGTVAFVNGSATVTGTGTLFTTELQVGDVLMMDASPATVRGTVASIQSNTSLTLVANATQNVSTAAYGIQKVPGSTDDVFIGNSEIGTAINLSLNINTTIKSLTFIAQSGISNTLDNVTNNLNVTQDVIVNQPNGGGATIAWNINAGSSTVSGNVSIVGTTANTSRIGKIAITTGTLNITGNLIYNPLSGSTDVQSVVDLSGGAANLNIGGTIQLLTGSGTLTPGTQSNVTFTTPNNTIPGGAGIVYNNVSLNQTSGTLTASGNIAVNGTLTTNATILDLATHALTTSLNAPNVNIIKTQNISATPIPSGMNWGGTFMYNSASSQTIVTGNYTNLDGTGGARTLGTTIRISGTFTTGAGAYIVEGSTVDYNGASNQTIVPLTYDILAISNSGTKTISSGTVTAKLSTSSASVLTLAGGTLSIAATPTINGIFNQTGGTFLSAYNTTIAGTFNQSSGTFHLASAVGTNPTDHLILTGTINQSGGTLAFKDYSGTGGTINQTGAGALIKVYHDWKVGTGNVFNSTAGTVQFSGNSGGSPNFAIGNNQFCNIIVDAGMDPGFSNTVGSLVNISGDFTNNNSTLTNTVSSTFNFNGAGNQTITSASSLSYLGHVIINKAGGTLILASNVGVAGNWTNNGGAVSGGSNTVTFSGLANSIGGTTSTTFPGIALADLAVITMNNNNSCTSLTTPISTDITTFTHSGNTALTVTGNVTINQPNAGHTSGWFINAGSATVSGNINIGGITGASTRVAKIAVTTGTLTVEGNVIYNSASATAPSAIIDLTGGAATVNFKGSVSLANGSGTLSPGTSSNVYYNGTGSQTIGGGSSISYYNFILNKASGTATLGGDLNVTHVILTQGTMSTGASNYNANVSGNWTNNGVTFIGGTSTVKFLGLNGTVGGTTSTAFPTIAIDGLSTTDYVMNNNNSCTTLSFNTGGFSSSFTHSGSAVLTVNGPVSISQPTTTATNAWNINAGSASVSGLLDFAGTNNSATRVGKIVITTGTLNANGGINFASNTAPASKVIDMSGGAGTLNLKGALTFGNLGGTLTAGTAGSIFNYADDVAAQTVRFFPGGAYHNLRTNNTNSGGATLSAAITTANVTGNFRILSGTCSNGGFAVALNTSKIFEVANGATYKMTGATGMVTGTSITKTFGASSTLEYAGTVQTVSAESYGNLIISGARTTNNITLANTGTIGIAGSFTPSATFTSGSYVVTGSTIDLNSSASQNIPSFTFNNLIISGGGSKTATGTININGTFTISSTVLTTTASNLLVFADNATTTGASLTGYVNGPVRKIGNDAFTFPVGKAGTGYMPVGISAPSNVTDAFDAEYMRASASGLSLNISAPGLFRVSNCDYWNLDRTTGTSSVNVTLSWNGYTNCNAAAYVTDINTLTVAHFNGTTWDSHGLNSITGNASSGSITRNGVSSFSPFAIGSTVDYGNPLTVKFNSVKAEKEQVGAKVSWTNSSEINIVHYEIERSSGSAQFTKTGQVSATGNNGDATSYQWLDISSLSGTVYYRIKAVALDGSITYSATVKVDASIKSAVQLYPNPVSTDQLHIEAANLAIGVYEMKLYNMSGKQIDSKSLNHRGGAIKELIELPAVMPPGIYNMHINGNGLNLKWTFIRR